MALEIILFSIGLLLLFAKIMGEFTERFGLTSIVGEIAAGVVLGPLIGIVVVGGFLENFITLGIIVLLFLVGLEVKFDDIKNNVYTASSLAIAAGLLSFLFGMLVGIVFFNDLVIGFAIGTVLVSTSDATLFSMMLKTKHFKSQIGKLIAASTIADDILGIMVFSFFSVFAAHLQLDLSKISTLFFVAIGMYLLVMTAGEKVIRFFVNIFAKFHDDQILLAFPIVVSLVLAYITNEIELSLAAGAFLAGMTMANTEFGPTVIEPKVRLLGHSLLIPLFNSAVGTMLVFSNLNFLLVMGIFLAAVFGKFIGTALISGFLHIRREDAKMIGISLIPRGNENIALAQLVFILGLISATLYTSIIFAVIATVIATPILMKIFYK